jgi:hypothetical protein
VNTPVFRRFGGLIKKIREQYLIRRNLLTLVGKMRPSTKKQNILQDICWSLPFVMDFTSFCCVGYTDIFFLCCLKMTGS